MSESIDTTSSRIRYLGFANAKLPDTDYRIGFARDSTQCDVLLVLPSRPNALPAHQFEQTPIGEGFNFRTVRGLISVPRLLHRHRADIAHFYATQFILGGPLLARLSGVRAVITVTGTGRSFSNPTWLGRLSRAMYVTLFVAASTLSDRILFQNTDDRELLTSYLPKRLRSKVETIGSAIDRRNFTSAVGVPKRSASLPVIVTIARIHPSKGIQDFLDLSAVLHHKARFVLVGPASHGSEDLLRQVEAASDVGRIEYLGQLADWEVRSLLSSADIVLLPSRGEGLPRVALEAGTCRVPTVAYDIPGCRSAVPSSLLVEPYDTQQMQQKLETLLRDADARSVAGQLCHDLVQADFAIEDYVARLDDILRTMRHD